MPAKLPAPRNPILSQAPQQSLPQLLWNELSAKDVFSLVKIMWYSLLGGAVHALTLSTFLLIGWVLQSSFWGQVFLPNLFKAVVGVADKLIPAVLGSAGWPVVGLVVGGYIAYPFISAIVNSSFFDSDKRSAKYKSQSDGWQSWLYFSFGFVVPTIWFCMRISSGMMIWDSLWAVNLLGAGVGATYSLLEQGQTFLNTVMMRMMERQNAPLPQSVDRQAASNLQYPKHPNSRNVSGQPKPEGNNNKTYVPKYNKSTGPSKQTSKKEEATQPLKSVRKQTKKAR